MAVSQAQTRPRNVLILYSDDHSHHALGAVGNREVLTPNLDRLAAEGMLFTQAHVMGGHQGAVCVPSRAMLLTGRYVNRLPKDGSTIPSNLISLPEWLRARDYTTYHTGKWHSDKASHHRMFSTAGDVFFGGMHFPRDGGQEHPTVYAFDPDGEWPETLRRRADTFSSALYADNAIRFLSTPLARERPFLCYVAFTSPHDPRTPPARWAARYDPARISLPGNFLPQHPFDNGDLNVRDEQLFPRPLHPDTVRKDIAAYYAMISEMDEQVGRILEALRANGLDRNTLVVFAGDNGLAMGRHGLLGKQNLYEHSIRVPMVMAGPGIPRGTRYDGFIYLSDITPTLLDLLGMPRPESFEALSHASVLTHPERRLRDRIYNVYGSWSRSIKTSDGMKLILYNVDGEKREQLFDLSSDPLEMRDLSIDPAYAGRKARLRDLLRQEMRDKHDDLDIDAADWGRAAAGRKGRGS
jgi:arylsulfatase A-like enzyme